VASDESKIRRLLEVLPDAKNVARRLVDELAARGDPQTEVATSIFQRLTAINILIFDLRDRKVASKWAESFAEMAKDCTQSLAELKPLLEKAAAIARE